MKSKMTKLLALLMAAAILFSLAACGKTKNNETTESETTAVEKTTLTEETTIQAVTTTITGTAIAGETTAGTAVAGQTTTANPANTVPTTPAEILAAYTLVMDKAKTVKPAFKKYEFQELPDDAASRNITGGSAVMNPLLKLAGNFMTTEEKAKANPGVYEKGGDMKAFPLKDSNKGCLLTDVSAIKTASCEKLANGNYKLSITLNDEKDPAHYRSGNTAPSKTGSIFVPLDKSDVDPELSSGLVKAVVSNPVYSMMYSNCKVTLVYNPATQQVVSVDQILYNALSLKGKVVFWEAEGTQVLIMHYNIFDVVY